MEYQEGWTLPFYADFRSGQAPYCQIKNIAQGLF